MRALLLNIGFFLVFHPRFYKRDEKVIKAADLFFLWQLFFFLSENGEMRVVNEEYGEKFRPKMSVEDKSGKNLFKLEKKLL